MVFRVFHLILAAASVFSACTDQQEVNLFDPTNTFVRFDYNNTVNNIAQDSMLLKRGVADSLLIPVALSSAPRSDSVILTMSVNNLSGNFTEQVHFDIQLLDPTHANYRQLIYPPGQYVRFVHFREISEPVEGRHHIRLMLNQVHPDNIHLGFPGSGRGKTFDLIYVH
jgi:hypothetical protein